jgi:altronate hydrolase
MTLPTPPIHRIHTADNVGVATRSLEAGVRVDLGEARIEVAEAIPAGHKVALLSIPERGLVRKYGFPIGETTQAVAPGSWVHTHNLHTRLAGKPAFTFRPLTRATADLLETPTFDGYVRANGRVGIRNEIWVLNTVGCVNHAAERIARSASERVGNAIDGVFAFSHPYGCSQLGDDLGNTRKILAGLMRHSNAGGVLVIGLGCENNQLDELLRQAPDIDRSRLRFFNSQDVLDEVEEGLHAVAELTERMRADVRQPRPAADLVLGMKCGGSDGLSGITANPLVGRIADRISALGGGVLLTEVPEMFGAEEVLLGRAANEQVFQAFVRMIDDFKEYFTRHDQPIFENPSPGNKDGGLSTLEEKALGAIQKGGRATVTDVLRYGDPAVAQGLSVLEAPGNDAVSSTALVASGATLLLFTTGRGTPLGFPAPTLKISSNTAIAQKKPHWIDFNAGALLDDGANLDVLADALFARILDIASGRLRTQNEIQGVREIAIWKAGVTL